MTDLAWNRAFALEQTDGDEELLAELLDIFRDSSSADFRQIVSGLAAGDAELAANSAHSIKGASASLGLDGISRLAKDIEENAKTGQLDRAGRFVSDLEHLLAMLKDI